jgi:SAM-dependent methyltransferase
METKVTAAIDQITNAIYTHFLLRDVVAKLAPGALLLFSLSTLKHEPAEVVDYVASAGPLFIVFGLSASWVAAFGLQALGELTKVISLWPRNMTRAASRETIVAFLHCASAEEKRVVERYVVIKEATGLGAVSLSVATLTLALGDGARGLGRIHQEMPFLSLSMVLVGLLVWTHRQHLARQYETYEVVIQRAATHKKEVPVDLALSFSEDIEIYDRIRPEYPDALLGEICESTNLVRGSPILEVGPGSGKLTKHLVARGFDVTAVEPDTRFVAWLKKRYPCRLITAKLEQAPLPTAHYQAIIAGQSFHWVDWESGLRLAARALRPEGHVVLLWYRTEIVDEDARQMLDAVYARYPEVKARLPGSGSSRDRDPSAKLTNSGLFQVAKQPIECKEVRYHTPEEYELLARTESQHRNLDAERRSELIRRVSDVVRGLGGAIRVRYRFQGYIAQILPSGAVTEEADAGPTHNQSDCDAGGASQGSPT